MPFKSKAQIAKFAVLEKQGKIPQGTLEQWLSETPSVKKLPEKKKQEDRKSR